MSKIEKPWGFEEWLDVNGPYVVKRLFMKARCKCSLQYHVEKRETIYVLSGVLKLHIGPSIDKMETKNLFPGDNVIIEPTMIHRMEGVEDCYYLECSTNQLDDVVRISDDYGRV